jgi:xanthine dehydrogenase YagS FAD-binding subunit
MEPFRYVRPLRAELAVGAAASEDGAAFVAGGTSLVDLMRLGVEHPLTLVDVTALPIAAVEADASGGLRIGAMARNSDVAEHPEVVSRYPVLAQALLAGASPQLRNMASVGGNLLQRTRCPYFRHGGWPCNKRVPGSGCAAYEGDNRTHAVLGGSELCIATHPSDMCVALLALDAVVHTLGPRGARAIPIADFHRKPWPDPAVETALARGELVTHVSLPATPFAARSAYVKVRDRASFDFALASAAVALELAEGVVKSARVALGGVATTPWRSLEAEQVLVGHPPNPDRFRLAAREALAGAQPRAGNAFKVILAQRTLARALERVGGGAS